MLFSPAVLENPNPIQGHDQGQGGQGKFYPHDSSGTLDSYVHIALLNFMLYGHKRG